MSNRQTIISLSTGHAVLTFPGHMDYQDVVDLDDALRLQIRSLRRQTKKATVFDTIRKAKEAFSS